MDIVALTQSKRTEILAYVKQRVSFESYSWISNVFNDLNRKILFDKDEELAVKAYPLFANFVEFFETFVEDVTPGAILYTVYSCALQVGIRQLGDKVETLSDFIDNIDTTDWCCVNMETINAFDLRTNCLLSGVKFSGDPERDSIWACGLVTLTAVPYHKMLIGKEW